jgi:hypothetical protein
MVTLGARDCWREMPPAPMVRPFIFDEFADQRVFGSDQRPDGLALH